MLCVKLTKECKYKLKLELNGNAKRVCDSVQFGNTVFIKHCSFQVNDLRITQFCLWMFGCRSDAADQNKECITNAVPSYLHAVPRCTMIYFAFYHDVNSIGVLHDQLL